MTNRARMLWTGLFVLTPLPLLLALWGFSVDDAWIITRVVENGLAGRGYAFNPGAERTDAVTPFGLAEVIAGTCRLAGTSDALGAARWLGVLCALTSALAAAWVATSPSRDRTSSASPAARWLPWCTTLGLSPSLAAWAGAGLETPIIAALCTLGCALWDRDVTHDAGRGAALGALLLGLAVAERPELGAFALVAAVQLERSRAHPLRVPSKLGLLVLLALPPCTVALLRFAWFGTPLPLSLLAKEPDLAFGTRYLVGSLFLCGPLLLLGWLVASRSARRVWLPAFLAHGAAILLAGGDWMPLYRLWVPVLPWLVAIVTREWRPSRRAIVLALAPALPSVLLLWVQGSSVRSVLSRREQMVQELRPLLASARVTAAVDIGWVGRASPSTIVDLAGVTDPRVAALPGGHTSKHIAPGFFAARSVDSWVIRAADRSYVPGAPLGTIRAVYAVDGRLLQREQDLGFVGVGVIALPGTSEQYVVARHEPARR